MQKLESFMILVSNLSDVYIFTVVTMFSVAAVAIYCAKIMNRNLAIADKSTTGPRKGKKKDKNSDTEEDDDDVNDDNSQRENGELEDLSRDFVREMKAAKLKQIEKTLTNEQIEEERRIENQQLAAIFELLKKQEEEFNTAGMDETEFKRQLSLYR